MTGNMQDNFVPFHLASELESIGFNEPCFGLLTKVDKELIIKEVSNQEECKLYFGGILAPLYQQCFEWFREKHGVLCDIDFGIGWGFGFIPIGTQLNLPDIFQEGYNTHKQAEIACIEKLIEIVKSK